MNCEPMREQLPLLLYGELSFDEEEAVETHLEGCADCRSALERERELLAVFDQVAVEPSPALLRASRESLAQRLAMEPAPVAVEVKVPQPGLWDRFIDMVTMPMNMLRPAGAVALVAVGFLGARLVPAGMPGGLGAMSIADVGSSRVRSVEPAADGTIHIVLDETRQRSVDGHVDDAAIRELLLGATKDPSDGLRAETVALLTKSADASDVRNALMYTIRNDQNAGVRLKALEGLKAFTGDADVRSALADVLSVDTNPAMRIRSIDLLVQSLDKSSDRLPADRRIVGVFQELLSREQDPYMRQLCQRALDLMNASSEVY
ncbi:MAG: anti-sigma factor [Bryobacteraceae bacterium]